jgi:RNA polymerase-interacting CarD/CdnL/TRCF family regulator
MSPHYELLRPGDPVFHPKYGFGTVHGLTRRDRAHPMSEPSPADAESDRNEDYEDYYDIQLTAGGTLLVPVNRAESVGLRRLTNGIEAVKASLASPAQSLPVNLRERAVVLRTREQLLNPEALAHCVRDMLAYSHGRPLPASEQVWLEKACLRLSTEVALVDRVSPDHARSAVWDAIAQFGAIK